MSTELSTLLSEIERQKNEYIVPENIKKDITVFGVTGELDEIDTSDATASSTDIVMGKSAYVDGEKIQGTLIEVKSGESDTISSDVISVMQNGLQFSGDMISDKVYRGNSSLNVTASNNDIAVASGLTPDKLIEGNTVLGVVGEVSPGYNVSGQTVTGVAKEEIEYSAKVKITTEKVIDENANTVDVIDIPDSKFKTYNHIISPSCKYIWSFADKRRLIIRLDDDGNVISRDYKSDTLIESDDAFVVGVNEDDTLAWCFDIVDGVPKVKVEKIETGDIFTFYPTPVENYTNKRLKGSSGDCYYQGLAVNDSFYVLVDGRRYYFGFNRETNELAYMYSYKEFPAGNPDTDRGHGPLHGLYYDKSSNHLLAMAWYDYSKMYHFIICTDYTTIGSMGRFIIVPLGINWNQYTGESSGIDYYLHNICCNGSYLVGSNDGNAVLDYLNASSVFPFTGRASSGPYIGLKYYDGTFGVGYTKIWKFPQKYKFTEAIVAATTTEDKPFCSSDTLTLSVTADNPIKYWFRDYVEDFQGESVLVRRVSKMVGTRTVTCFTNAEESIAPIGSYGISKQYLAKDDIGDAITEFTIDTTEIDETTQVLRDVLGIN